MCELAEAWLAIQGKAVGTDMAAFSLRLPPIRAQSGQGPSPKSGSELRIPSESCHRLGATPMDGVLILLRSAHDEQAAAILHRKFDTHFATPLTGLLSDEGRPQRAVLLLSVMAGFQVIRQVIGMNGLVEAREEHLAPSLEPLFSILVGEQTP